MDDKALMQMLLDILEYYKKQSKYLLWALIFVVAMHVATICGFLYYESQMETTVTTTTTQTTTNDQEVNGDDGSIVNGDQYNDESQNRSN